MTQVLIKAVKVLDRTEIGDKIAQTVDIYSGMDKRTKEAKQVKGSLNKLLRLYVCL